MTVNPSSRLEALYPSDGLSVISPKDIFRRKRQNQALAAVIAVVVAVAAAALFLFVLVRFFIVPNAKFEINPSYNPINKFGPNSFKYKQVADGSTIIGGIGLGLGISLLPLGVGLGVYALVGNLLEKWRIDPLFDLRSQLNSVNSQAPIMDRTQLISLVKHADRAGRGVLLEKMDFTQLTLIKNSFGTKKFYNLIKSRPSSSARQWTRIIEFSRLSQTSMKRVLTQKERHPYLFEMMKCNNAALQEIDSVIQKQKNVQVKELWAARLSEFKSEAV